MSNLKPCYAPEAELLVKAFNNKEKYTKALKAIKYYQRWRRGADTPQPNATEIGLQIDVAIEALEILAG